MRWALGLAALAVAGCSTTEDRAAEAPEGRWLMSADYETVSTCLVRAMNFEFTPKSGAAVALGRSVSHSVAMVEPGRVNHVVHEHIMPYTGWVLKVTSIGAKQSEVTAHAMSAPIGRDAVGKMRSAAGNCGGVPA